MDRRGVLLRWRQRFDLLSGVELGSRRGPSLECGPGTVAYLPDPSASSQQDRMVGNCVGGRVGTVSDDDADVWTAGYPGLER